MASLATKSIADGVTSRMNDGGRALLPGPDPPDFEPVRVLRGFNHWFTCVTPLCLACRTQAIWRYWPVPALSGLLPPDAASPGSGCPPLHRTAATAQRWGPTPHTVQQRLMAHDQALESRVNSEPGRANGTRSVRAPCCGHHKRRRRQWISSRQTPRSRCRQTESTGRLSFRARVEYSHNGQRRRRRLSATSTTTASRLKLTFLTHTPVRSRSLENAVVTRTPSLLASR